MPPASDNSESSEGNFIQLLARHEPEIRAFIRASIPSPLDVSEIMQNVSLVAWKKFSDLDNPETDFARWTCVIARYEILKFRRARARDRFVLDEDIIEKLCEEGEEELSLRGAQIEQLELCLSQLPAGRRELVMRAYSPGSSIKDIAAERGMKPNALYQLLRRIRVELEKCILTHAPDPEATA